KTGDVATWFCQRSDRASANWVYSYREHDGDRRGYLHCGGNCAANRSNDIDLEPNELGRDFAVPFWTSLGPTVFDRNCAALDPAKLVQSLNKGHGPLAPDRRRAGAQKPYGWQFSRLLCACRERASGRRAEKGYELAPPHARPQAPANRHLTGLMKLPGRAKATAYVVSEEAAEVRCGSKLCENTINDMILLRFGREDSMTR